ncbi:FxsA family protein [Afifella sp. IM 167]|uniref:FxsA family protein n=1 Tax=Afifella sp. IM 167 TaxID=2033586 RepID=UPI001CC91BCD|nr:FxsA family protein [Afifella sp. IM 167]MBZ8133535.1 membrane protein FxsA [Afifella sp. IM 167]
MPIFLLLLAIPLVEVAVFVLVGQYIGLAATLLLVLLTAVIGTVLLRHQGLRTIMRIRTDLEQNRMPGRSMADGAMIAAAGLLLLTPGFVTDTIGFLLFVPSVRQAIFSFAVARLNLQVVSARQHYRTGPDGEVIDLEEEEFEVRPPR